MWRILPVIEPILGQPDKDFGFDSTPGARGIWTAEHRARLQINSLGLRDIEREVVKPEGTFRVGLLGDSMVEAAQVSQEATFGALAERGLRADGYNVELINLGIAGPNPIRQLWRLEKRGYPLSSTWWWPTVLPAAFSPAYCSMTARIPPMSLRETANSRSAMASVSVSRSATPTIC